MNGPAEDANEIQAIAFAAGLMSEMEPVFRWSAGRMLHLIDAGTPALKPLANRTSAKAARAARKLLRSDVRGR